MGCYFGFMLFFIYIDRTTREAMITEQISSERIRGKLPVVKCRLCQAAVKKTSKIVRLGTSYGVICHDCAEEFDPKDRELIFNMCTAFGGYYGKLRDKNTNNYQIIKAISEQYNIHYKGTSLTSLDVRALHQAFLYGISPAQIVQSLRILS